MMLKKVVMKITMISVMALLMKMVIALNVMQNQHARQL